MVFQINYLQICQFSAQLSSMPKRPRKISSAIENFGNYGKKKTKTLISVGKENYNSHPPSHSPSALQHAPLNSTNASILASSTLENTLNCNLDKEIALRPPPSPKHVPDGSNSASNPITDMTAHHYPLPFAKEIEVDGDNMVDAIENAAEDDSDYDHSWESRKPPSLDEACKALADLNQLIKPHRLSGRGYKECLLPLKLRT